MPSSSVSRRSICISPELSSTDGDGVNEKDENCEREVVNGSVVKYVEGDGDSVSEVNNDWTEEEESIGESEGEGDKASDNDDDWIKEEEKTIDVSERNGDNVSDDKWIKEEERVDESDGDSDSDVDSETIVDVEKSEVEVLDGVTDGGTNELIFLTIIVVSAKGSSAGCINNTCIV